jgi:arabinogalactan oligomer/maltooligosaccharide transport system permease protein
MRESISVRRQIVSQLLALALLATVLFPVLWIVSMAIDPRNVSRPTSLLPAGASLRAFREVLSQPTPNPVSFVELARNSMILAVGVSALTVLVGTTAAYAFSRFRFPGREIGMIGFILVLMLPSVATVTPLFVLLNIVLGPDLRNSIMGVGLAMIATALPFAIWNMKGFIDTIPKELEEAALLDGASPNQTFYKIMLPLALPGLAVTALWGFMAGWTEFILSWQFISNPQWFTLSMALYGMQGQYASNTPWAEFAAMALIVSIPVVVVFFGLQKYIVGGLTIGGVKG